MDWFCLRRGWRPGLILDKLSKHIIHIAMLRVTTKIIETEWNFHTGGSKNQNMPHQPIKGKRGQLKKHWTYRTNRYYEIECQMNPNRFVINYVNRMLS